LFCSELPDVRYFKPTSTPPKKKLPAGWKTTPPLLLLSSCIDVTVWTNISTSQDWVGCG